MHLGKGDIWMRSKVEVGEVQDQETSPRWPADRGQDFGSAVNSSFLNLRQIFANVWPPSGQLLSDVGNALAKSPAGPPAPRGCPAVGRGARGPGCWPGLLSRAWAPCGFGREVSLCPSYGLSLFVDALLRCRRRRLALEMPH